MAETKNLILVLGASSDIGGEIIRHIANEEVTVLAHYNTRPDKIELLQKQSKGCIIPLKANLSDEGEVCSLIETIKNSYSHPGKIIHLAAPRVVNTRFKDLCWTTYQQQINIQVKSLVMILKEFLPLMARDKKGKVLVMLSSYVQGVPPKAMADYIVAKYALLGLVKELASEYAEKQININAVSPSMTDTAFLQNIHEKVVEINAEKHPLKRNALPSDIAPLFKFLLSEEANFINGANIPVTGGESF